MSQFDLLRFAHSGLRTSLYQTALLLQETDFLSDDQAEEACCRVAEALLLADGKADRLSREIFPAIATFEPSVAATLAEKQAEASKLGEALESHISRLLRSGAALQKLLEGRALISAFHSYLQFQLHELSCAEAIANRILWRYYSDDELRGIAGRIGSVSPDSDAWQHVDHQGVNSKSQHGLVHEPA